LEKVKIYELAKQLNVESKRLIEKLEELDIHVKSHMSSLSTKEVNALYDHIGYIRHEDEDATQKSDEVKKQQNMNVKNMKKDIPRIIRKTEIRVDSEKNEPNKKPKKDYVKVSESNDGLIAGYRRGSKKDLASASYRNTERQYVNNEGLNNTQRTKTEDDKPQKVELESFADKTNKSIEQPLNNVPEKNEEKIYSEPKSAVTKGISTSDNQAIDTNQKLAEGDQTDRRGAEISLEANIKNQEGNSIENDRNRNDYADIKNENRQINRPEGNYELRGQNRSDDKQQGGNQSFKNENRSDNRNDNRSNTEKRSYNQPSGYRNNGNDRYDNQRTDMRDNRDSRREGYKPNFKPGDNEGKPSYRQGNRDNSGFNRDNRDNSGFNRDNRDNRDNRSNSGFNRDNRNNSGFNRDNRNNSGFNRDNSGFNRDNRDNRSNSGFNRDNRDNRSNSGFNRDNSGFNRDNSGFNRDNRDNRNNSGFNRDNRDNRNNSGFNRDNRDNRNNSGFNRNSGGFNRDNSGYNKDDDTNYNTNRRSGGKWDSQRSGGRQNNKSDDSLVIPKANVVQTEEKTNQRGERRSFHSKDLEKGAKRENKREVSKNSLNSGREGRFRTHTSVIGEKKSVSEVMSDDFALDNLYDDSLDLKKKERKIKKAIREKHIPPKAVLTNVKIGESITVKTLSETLKKTSAEVIRKLMAMGVMATLNQELDFDTAVIVADEFHIKAEKEVTITEEDILFDDSDDIEGDLEERAPVVVVMGHVDHGKTSLLDVIRETNVTESEAGGITQHIGAYKVRLNGRDITFLDTPGHEAFTSMRARGAKATDIAILVVAANDGVMPQTVEAINHAKAAGVAIIVAINKIDLPGANPDKVKQELTEHGLLVEEWGGDVIAVPVSAKARMNIDQLLEMILLSADMLELKANPNKQAKGIVIEASLDKNRGILATLLVQRGTLKAGDYVISGTTVGRVRLMTDDKGKKLEEAGPSTPVEILGLSEAPAAGDLFYAVHNEKTAKSLIERRKSEQKEQQVKSTSKITLDDLFSQIQQGNIKDLNIIIKADVQGSAEAVKQSLEKLSTDEVKVNVIHSAVGAVTESDVRLAEVSNAIVICFNVRPSVVVSEAATNSGVDIRLYSIIYEAIADVEAAMKGLLDPTYKEVVDGHVEIRQTFKVSSVGTIGGGYVLDGKIFRNSEIRVVRDSIVVFTGKIDSLKRFKDDVKEVAHGYECGITLEKYNDIKEGDIIEAFHMEEVAR